jgi:6-phosphogluconolactonase
MADIREHEFPDGERLAEALAEALSFRICDAVAQRNHALFALSGGRSPAAVFDRLASQKLDWQSVTVTQVDERWLAPEDAASNSRLIREHLLQGPAASATFLGMKNGATTAGEGQPACEAMLRALPLPVDFTLLGMGEDGHTASIFPGAPELGHALTTDALCAAATATVAPHERITLTVAGLLRSRVLILQLSGAAKIAVYRRALEDGPVEEMPVRAILRQDQVPVEVWLAP